MTETAESNGNIERQLAEQGFYVSTTVGCSMRPMLRNRRDRVIVLPIGDERLKKYDLPLYRRPDGLNPPSQQTPYPHRCGIESVPPTQQPCE